MSAHGYIKLGLIMEMPFTKTIFNRIVGGDLIT